MAVLFVFRASACSVKILNTRSLNVVNNCFNRGEIRTPDINLSEGVSDITRRYRFNKSILEYYL